MSFVKVKQPPDSRLAICTPRGWMHGYEKMAASEHGFWEQEEIRAESAGNLPYHALAHDIHGIFHQTATELTSPMVIIFGHEILEPHDRERIRRMMLGALAMSRFMRTNPLTSNQGRVLQDGLAAGQANVLADMDAEDTGMPLDYRLHVDREWAARLLPAGSDDQWYRHGKLLLHKTANAEPSPGIVSHLAAHNITVDFSNMSTLYPFMVSAPTRH